MNVKVLWNWVEVKACPSGTNLTAKVVAVLIGWGTICPGICRLAFGIALLRSTMSLLPPHVILLSWWKEKEEPDDVDPVEETDRPFPSQDTEPLPLMLSVKLNRISFAGAGVAVV